VRFAEIANYPIIVNAGKGIVIESVHIRDSGSLNENGRNNASGGILLENGTSDFVVRGSLFDNVRGNGVWTHSRYESPRNSDGLIEGNEFRMTARDAIQIGHATRIRVLRNHGSKIGYPNEEVDIEGQGFPVAIDTSGNTDETIYAENAFEDLNGKCIDLDGFHHGEIRDNRCINNGPLEDYPLGHFGIVMNNANPDMESAEIKISGNIIDGAVYGGLFLIGSRHEVLGNQFLNLNRVGCRAGSADPRCNYWPDEPALLRTGIYLGKRAERPADTRDNVIRDNVITGLGMHSACIAAAPGLSLSDNQIGENECREEE
jgi:nitrous oxidase accessory protein NosD